MKRSARPGGGGVRRAEVVTTTIAAAEHGEDCPEETSQEPERPRQTPPCGHRRTCTRIGQRGGIPQAGLPHGERPMACAQCVEVPELRRKGAQHGRKAVQTATRETQREPEDNDTEPWGRGCAAAQWKREALRLWGRNHPLRGPKASKRWFICQHRPEGCLQRLPLPCSGGAAS